jgi:hypothetical protein
MKWSILIPWVLSLLTITAGIWQYADKRAQSNKEPFLRKQLELSFEASDVAARLATESDPEEWEEARKSFWRLYWGTLAMVEDRGVESAMVKLGKIVPKEPTTTSVLPMTTLETPSLELAYAARLLILASWKVDLPPLAGRVP